MLALSAQISVYPLGQTELAPTIDAAIGALRGYPLELDTGPMSTIATGDDEWLFLALRDAMRAAATQGGAVMVVTISNACPIDGSPASASSAGSP